MILYALAVLGALTLFAVITVCVLGAFGIIEIGVDDLD